MNVLAVGAHHDDIELGCGGTLARLARAGHKTYGLTLTNSETHYDIRAIHRAGGEARAEAERAAAVLGLTRSELELTPSDNGRLSYDVELMRSIEQFIEEHSITLVFSHWRSDLNTDHEAAAQLTIVAARHVPSVLMYRSNWYQPSQPFNGTFFFDISTVIDLKKQCLDCYLSEIKNRGREWIDSFVDSNRAAGFAIGRHYAEVFEPVRFALLEW
jgi:N-acetylglucosamine malate deacetylase 1